MNRISKNKKFLSVFVVFSLTLLLFFSLITSQVKAQSPECERSCSECTNADCALRPNKCEWDGIKSECCRKLEINWPESPMGTSMNGCTSLPVMIKYFYEWGVLLGGLATFIALVLAGFKYLTSAGDPSKMKDARSGIMSAIMGLVLVLSSWLILNTINPELTTFHNVTFNPVDVNALLEKFTTGETEPCDFAFVYKEKNYGRGSGFAVLPWRKNVLGIKTTEYVLEDNFKSVEMFIQCNICTADEITADGGLPVAEQKCQEVIKLDGSSVYYLKEELAATTTDNSGTIVNVCTQQLLPALPTPECVDGVFDCESFYKKGGACTLQLSAGKAWWDIFGEFCADRIGETAGSHPNLNNLSDRKIDCIKLIKHEAGNF